MEHRRERDRPRVAVWSGVIDQYRHSGVDPLRYLGITLSAEDGTGPSIRIKQLEVGGCQLEPPIRIVKILDPVREENEVRTIDGSLQPRHGQKAELVTAVNPLKNRRGILEVEQRHEAAIIND